MSETLPAQTTRLVGYFPAGAIRAQTYHVADIPAGLLSRVIYAFADVTAAGDRVSINAQENPSVPQSGRNKRRRLCGDRCARTNPVRTVVMVKGDDGNETSSLVRRSHSTASTRQVRARYLFIAVAFMRRFRREVDGAS